MFRDFYSKRAVIDGLSIDGYTLHPIGPAGPDVSLAITLSLASSTHHSVDHKRRPLRKLKTSRNWKWALTMCSYHGYKCTELPTTIGSGLIDFPILPLGLQVKKGIPRIRENLTDYIWNYTSESSVLIQKNWTDMIALELQVSADLHSSYYYYLESTTDVLPLRLLLHRTLRSTS